MQPSNVVERSLVAVDDRIAQLEKELAELSSDESADESSDESANDQREERPPPAKKPKSEKICPDFVGSSTAAPLPLYCEACGVSVTSEELMREHMQGKKHKYAAKMLEAKAESRYCSACDIAFTGPDQLAEHMKGRKHRDRVAQLEGGWSNGGGKGGGPPRKDHGGHRKHGKRNKW